MKVSLDSEVIAKLSPRGILTYVAMGMCGVGASVAQLAAAIRVDEKLITDGLKSIGPVQILELQPKPKAKKPKPVVVFRLPEWVDPDAWSGYEEMRRRTNKPMTDRARELAVARLKELETKGNLNTEVLNQSILMGWQALYEIKRDDGRGFQQPAKKPLQPTEFKM